MIISNVTIENFRCYYGQSNIEFNQNGKVTLIFGDSGYGKSSFLQFFRWMFYGNPDFGDNDDQPLVNNTAVSEAKSGSKIKVFGQIDFEHLGVKYSLSKTQYFVKRSKLNSDIEPERPEPVLLFLEDGNWVQFNGDLANKINSIMPIELSQYFLLDGEKARDIVLDPTGLKKAILALFGLDAYELALSHIGVKSKKISVLGSYQHEMTSKMTTATNKNISVAELQESMQDIYDQIECLKSLRSDVIAEGNVKTARKEAIFKTLGQVSSRNNVQQLIDSNNALIKVHEDTIKSTKRKIGDLFYSCYPYIFLSRVANKSSSLLREKNVELASNYKNIFENLNKPLIKEILDKNLCVCGKTLDDDDVAYLNGILDTMPPDSYEYMFGQFVNKAKSQIKDANSNIMSYYELMGKISEEEKFIDKLNAQNKEKLDELKRLDSAKDLVEELENIKNDLLKLENKKSDYDKMIAKKAQLYQIADRQLQAALQNERISEDYKEKLEFFESMKDLLTDEKVRKEKEVRDTLNLCVRDMFKKLTTQTELDADRIDFVNTNFSLRTTYLTGGQLAVDVYAYVIGIVKALQECEMDNNENPIIIDAPFAFTGNEQSEHIFKTLPAVSKQTVLLTLDVNKIKNLLSNDDLYELYCIKNESQERATIEKGNVNDLKF